MKKCKHCLEQVPKKATKCKHCGGNLGSWINNHPIIVIAIILLIVFLYNSSKDINSSSYTSSSSVNSAPILQVKSFKNYKQYDYAYIVGEVENISNKKLLNVKVLGVYYDENKEIIKTDSALIEYDPLLPKQISPFKVMTRDNPAIESAAVTFQFLDGQLIPTKQINGDITR